MQPFGCMSSRKMRTRSLGTAAVRFRNKAAAERQPAGRDAADRACALVGVFRRASFARDLCIRDTSISFSSAKPDLCSKRTNNKSKSIKH
jgi:hypothetical protein